MKYRSYNQLIALLMCIAFTYTPMHGKQKLRAYKTTATSEPWCVKIMDAPDEQKAKILSYSTFKENTDGFARTLTISGSQPSYVFVNKDSCTPMAESSMQLTINNEGEVEGKELRITNSSVELVPSSKKVPVQVKILADTQDKKWTIKTFGALDPDDLKSLLSKNDFSKGTPLSAISIKQDSSNMLKKLYVYKDQPTFIVIYTTTPASGTPNKIYTLGPTDSVTLVMDKAPNNQVKLGITSDLMETIDPSNTGGLDELYRDSDANEYTGEYF